MSAVQAPSEAPNAIGGASLPEHRRTIRTNIPGVYKRGDRYVAITRFNGKQVRTYHRTKSEARAAKAKREGQKEMPPSQERFGEYAERWLTEYEGRRSDGIAATTRADYELLMRQFVIPYFDSRRLKLGEVGTLAVRDFIRHLRTLKPKRPQHGAERYSAATIRRIVTPLFAMLAEAYELELIPREVKVRVTVPGGKGRVKVKPKTITHAQQEALLHELDPRYRLLFAFLANTGVRIGEALGAQWRDLEHSDEGPVLVVRRQYYRGELIDRTKTAAGARTVALLPSLVQELTRQRAKTKHAADDSPIFASSTGTHMDAHNVRRVLRKAARAAGCPWVTPHVFRHSLATELRDQGYDTGIIAKVLGHTDEAFTRAVYLHTRDAPRFDELDSALRLIVTDDSAQAATG